MVDIQGEKLIRTERKDSCRDVTGATDDNGDKVLKCGTDKVVLCSGCSSQANLGIGVRATKLVESCN